MGPLFGASAERLAEFIIGGFAFTTPVPWHVDIGHDFHCVLHRPAATRRMLLAGPAFSVQVKSTRRPVVYRAGPEADWLSEQGSPFFLCIVDRSRLTCEIYSTWNVHNAHLLHGALRTVLEPNSTAEQIELPTLIDDTLHVPLGPPVLRLTPQDAVDSDRAKGWAEILELWIWLDSQNIVNRRAGMYWVQGPRRWTTNQPLAGEVEMLGRFYANPKNLAGCVVNLGRSAVALRKVMSMWQVLGYPLDRAQVDAVDRLLQAFEDNLDPLAEQALEDPS